MICIQSLILVLLIFAQPAVSHNSSDYGSEVTQHDESVVYDGGLIVGVQQRSGQVQDQDGWSIKYVLDTP